MHNTSSGGNCKYEDNTKGNVPDKVIVKGSGEWNKTVKNIKEGTGKGINVRVKNKDDAIKLLEEARPNIKKYDTYSNEKYKIGYEIHPAEPNVGNNLPHIKWKDWSKGKSDGAEGHIFFD